MTGCYVGTCCLGIIVTKRLALRFIASRAMSGRLAISLNVRVHVLFFSHCVTDQIIDHVTSGKHKSENAQNRSN